MIPPRFIGGAVALATAAALAVPATAGAAKPTAQGRAAQYLVSLGDSYATGFQPAHDGQPTAANTREGFVYQIPALAARKGWKLKIAQFGCGGATTTSILEEGCMPAALGPGGKPYADGQTQIEAAEAFLRKHRAKVGLITVSIGGNDVTRCAREADAVTCTAAAAGTLRRNVATLARRLRRAAGPRVRIVGTTYPNVILGSWLAGDAGRSLAELSVTAFRMIINPALRDAYAGVGGQFVDVTDATGGYIPLDQTTTVEGLGTIPVAVARVCDLTWFCAVQDIHARASGYRVIADLVVRTLPRQTARRATRRAGRRGGRRGGRRAHAHR